MTDATPPGPLPGVPAARILPTGPPGARPISDAGDKLVLFVCSGNTCRSPMAAALARHLAADPAARIESAGTSAAPGMDATPEAREALRRLGVELGEHRSRPLTPQLIREADEIVCMTQAHMAAVLDIDPDAGGKTTTLDTRGIPDPIGGPLELYLETAHTLRRLIERRMQEAQL